VRLFSLIINTSMVLASNFLLEGVLVQKYAVRVCV